MQLQASLRRDSAGVCRWRWLNTTATSRAPRLDELLTSNLAISELRFPVKYVSTQDLRTVGTALQREAARSSGTDVARLGQCLFADKRLKCFEHVVDLVNRHALPGLRAGYYRRTVKSLLAHDPKLHGLCFSGLTFMVQPYLAANFVLPIMDRVHGRYEDVMAQMVHNAQILTASPWISKESITISHPENLGDVHFASSRYSVLIQFADVVGYLLHIRDRERQGDNLVGFKGELLTLAKRLQDSLVNDQVVAMQWG
jgi:hypothetical protein